MIHPQPRTSCGPLGRTQADLAGAARVGVDDVRRLDGGDAASRSASPIAIRQALEAAGVISIDTDGRRPGVRLWEGGT